MIPTPEQIQAARDDLARFERVPDDGSQREYRPVRPHSLRVALAAMDDARDNAGAAEELAREADAQRKAAEADIAALRLEHESWGAIIDGLRASLATVTRERDEARKALATEEHNHELTIARRDDAQSWADSLANQIAEAADHEIGEHSNLNNPWDNAQDGLVKLVRERDELRAQLDNAAIRERTKVVMLVASLGAAYLSRHGGGGDYCRALADVANLIDLTTPDPDALAGGKS